MTGLEILALISLIGSAVGGGIKTYQASKYKKEAEKYTKEEKERQKAEVRRQALQRAIKSNLIFRPYEAGEPPEVPDTTVADIIQALGGAGAGVATMAMGQQQPSYAEQVMGAGKKGLTKGRKQSIEELIREKDIYEPYYESGGGYHG